MYPLAGPFRRLFAYLIDLAVMVGVVIVGLVMALILSVWTSSGSGFGPFLVGFFVLQWGYGAGSEGLFNGRTIGKARWVFAGHLGRIDHHTQAVLRNFVGTIDGWLPFWYLPGLSAMMLTSKFQRLGDLAAGTMVVVEERQRRSGVVNEAAVAALLPWLPLRIAAGPELSRVLSDYVRRRERFPPALREEMGVPLARPLRLRFALPADADSDAVLCVCITGCFSGSERVMRVADRLERRESSWHNSTIYWPGWKPALCAPRAGRRGTATRRALPRRFTRI